jgi:hypothetical protein
MEVKLNPLTGKFDLIGMTATEISAYVKIAGDTMTGALTITPVSGDTALKVNKDIKILAGQKIIFDGD